MGLYRVYKEIINNVRDYYYNVYGDNIGMEDYINSTVKDELKNLGIINGDDEMVWKSPSQDLYFEVIREYSTSKYVVKEGYQYVCTLNIKNELKITLASIKFTEIDAIRILSGFVDFCNPMWEFGGTNIVYIDINPNNTTMEKYTIVLEEIPLGELPGVLFKINKYHPYYQSIATVCTMVLTFEQLNDLAFHLFFALLIDIEVPVEYDEQMFAIEDYITTDVYWIFERRRQKLQELQEKHPEKANYIQSYINHTKYYMEPIPMNDIHIEEVQHPIIPEQKIEIPKQIQEPPRKGKLRIKVIQPRSNNT